MRDLADNFIGPERPGNPQRVSIPLVIGYPHGVLVHRRINQRPYADARLDAGQFPVAPQAASKSSFLLQEEKKKKKITR